MSDPNRMHDFDPAMRIRLIGAVALALLGLLLLRLWHVQVRQGPEHRRAITRQSIRPIRLNPVRGRIIAGDGSVLVDNDARYDVVFRISEMRQPGRRSRTVDYVLEAALELSRRIGRPMPIDSKALLRHMDIRPAMPLTVFTGLDEKELAAVAERTPPVPGLEIVPTAVRSYAYPGLASHVLGFTGMQPPEETADLRRFRRAYSTPELRGRSGLELRYDRELSGTGGSKLVRVNILEYVHEEIGTTKAPVNGKDLILTLDPKAQWAAEALLQGLVGAIVVVDVTDGAILALASSPRYDSSSLTAAEYARLLGDTIGRPLFNRALSGTYTPGSILKPLIGLAALESGAVTPDELYECTGRFPLSSTRGIRCWDRGGHGRIGFIDALKYSCNPYLIHAGVATGLDSIQPILASAGIGSPPGIDLPAAAGGLIPSREYARKAWGQDWILSDTAFLSIGQGAITISPLQAAMYTAAIANDGWVFRPFLVRSIRNPDGTVWRNTAPKVEHRLPVKPENLALVREGMYQAVNAEDGTATRAGNPAIPLAGKTGTAEVRSGAERHKNTWFICFGPADSPKYAFACVVERGDSGGRTVAPLASRFFSTWLLADE